MEIEFREERWSELVSEEMKNGIPFGGLGDMRQEFGMNSFKLEDFLIQDQDLCVFSSSKTHYLSEKPAVIETVLRKCLASSS